jgi:hypothetical protein
MKSHFLEDYHRGWPERLAIKLERHYRLAALAPPVTSLPPVARLMAWAAARMVMVDAPVLSRRGVARLEMPTLAPEEAARRTKSRGSCWRSMR